MKFIKGLVLFCFLAGSISACFEAPEFTNTPEISFNRIQFKETPSPSDFDTLVLYIDFKDGNGDLGLDDNYSGYPYNNSFYYITAGINDTTKISTILFSNAYAKPNRTEPIYKDYILVTLKDTDILGKLVTNRTRLNQEYSYLPVYNSESCLNYSKTEVLVPESYNMVDETYSIIDTVYDYLGNRAFVIKDVLLYSPNANHNNIEIIFEYLDNGEYKVFDWYKEFCSDFNGRFPVLGNEKRPLEGTIRYAMANSSFLTLFNVKTLRLRIKIKDRALNISNEVITPSFTLTSIK